MDLETIRAKADAFVSGLENLTAQERKGVPSSGFCSDFNGLRDLVLKEYPGLAGVLPPPIKSEFGTATANYNEMYTYALQIVNQLKEIHVKAQKMAVDKHNKRMREKMEE